MRKMTQGSIARHLIAYALPLILGNLFQLTYNAVDSIVIGKFAGENALAAVSAANPVMTIVILGVSGVSIGAVSYTHLDVYKRQLFVQRRGEDVGGSPDGVDDAVCG